MKIDILTLFPDMFNGFKEESIIKRAIDDKKVKINTINFRDFAKNKHKKVDDTPFGGGAGMVLMCQPIFDAVESVKKKNSKVILLSPQGTPYTQEKAYELSKEKHLILICGHYEGFDERIRTLADEEISIGDYVLTGGELPAMVICDSVTRLLPGVIEEESHVIDSFNDNLLDYPTYTKPRNYKGLQVPDVLLSGDHARIEKWRHDKRAEATKEKRPDLLEKAKPVKEKEIKKKETSKKVEKKDNKYIDDVNEKKINPNKKTKYVLVKTDDINAITIFNPKLVIGYRLKGKKNSRYKNRIVIVKDKFIRKVAIKNLKKKIEILTYRFNVVLSNPDDDEGTSRILGEAEMLKQMVFSMYLKYLGQDNADKIIKSINVLINEFIRAKTLQNTIIPSFEENRRKM